MSFELPKLGYAYDALEPTIDAKTMEIHHTKHHQAYIDNLNKAIEGTELAGKTIEEILQNYGVRNVSDVMNEIADALKGKETTDFVLKIKNGAKNNSSS